MVVVVRRARGWMVVVVKQALCYCFAQSVVPELSVNFSQFVLVPEFVSAVRRQTSGEFTNI